MDEFYFKLLQCYSFRLILLKSNHILILVMPISILLLKAMIFMGFSSIPIALEIQKIEVKPQ